MAARNNSLKPVVVREHPVQSLAEAGIYSLNLEDGTKIVCVANTAFPNHDIGGISIIRQYLEANRPEVVVLLGHMIDEDSFKSLSETEVNFLHRLPDSKEFAIAMEEDGYEQKVLSLGKQCGQFIKSFGDFGATVLYIPSWTKLGLPSELGIMDYVQTKKRFLDGWTANHPEASELPSDPTTPLPTEFDELLGISGLANVQVLPYGAGILLNETTDKFGNPETGTLFLVGSFRRRQAGDASHEEWAQRGYDIVKSVDGKSASAWWTDTEHTFPHPVYNHHQGHEIGIMWDRTRNGHLGDYNRRAHSAGFFTVQFNRLFGDVVPLVRGTSGKRSMLIDKAYTESTPGSVPKKGTLKLAGSGERSTGLQQKPVRARQSRGRRRA